MEKEQTLLRADMYLSVQVTSGPLATSQKTEWTLFGLGIWRRGEPTNLRVKRGDREIAQGKNRTGQGLMLWESFLGKLGPSLGFSWWKVGKSFEWGKLGKGLG